MSLKQTLNLQPQTVHPGVEVSLGICALWRQRHLAAGFGQLGIELRIYIYIYCHPTKEPNKWIPAQVQRGRIREFVRLTLGYSFLQSWPERIPMQKWSNITHDQTVGLKNRFLSARSWSKWCLFAPNMLLFGETLQLPPPKRSKKHPPSTLRRARWQAVLRARARPSDLAIRFTEWAAGCSVGEFTMPGKRIKQEQMNYYQELQGKLDLQIKRNSKFCKILILLGSTYWYGFAASNRTSPPKMPILSALHLLSHYFAPSK